MVHTNTIFCELFRITLKSIRNFVSQTQENPPWTVQFVASKENTILPQRLILQSNNVRHWNVLLQWIVNQVLFSIHTLKAGQGNEINVISFMLVTLWVSYLHVTTFITFIITSDSQIIIQEHWRFLIFIQTISLHISMGQYFSIFCSHKESNSFLSLQMNQRLQSPWRQLSERENKDMFGLIQNSLTPFYIVMMLPWNWSQIKMKMVRIIVLHVTNFLF